MACLFAVDAVAGGLVVQALLARWLHHRFGAGLTVLGLVFFTANLLPALAQLRTPRLVARHGLLPTTVGAAHLILQWVPGPDPAGTRPGNGGRPAARPAGPVRARRPGAAGVHRDARQAPTTTPAAASVTTAARGVAVSVSPIAASMLLTGPFTLLGAPLLAGAGLAVVHDLAMGHSFRFRARYDLVQ